MKTFNDLKPGDWFIFNREYCMKTYEQGDKWYNVNMVYITGHCKGDYDYVAPEQEVRIVSTHFTGELTISLLEGD